MKSKKEKFKNKNIKVLFLLTQDLESPSGIGRYYPLSKNLTKNGLSVSIAALHSNFDSLEKHIFWQDRIKIAYVGQMHVKKENNKTYYFKPIQLIRHTINATWKLLRYVLNNPSDIIVIGKPHPMNSIAGLLGGWFVGSKIILDCDDYEAASNYFSSAWQRWIIRLFENNVPKLVHRIITNTMFNKNRMIDLGISPEKIDYLPNGVDKDRFSAINKEELDRIRAELNLENQRVIAYIGSLSLSNHPVDLLLQSFKFIVERESNVILLIVGGGKDLKTLQNLASELQIQNKIIFKGRVSPEQVPYYFALADVTVDPVYETDAAKGRCPLKMFESWIMKTPFVTADVGDRKKLAGNPPAAFLINPGDVHDLANKLIILLVDDEVHNQFSKLGHERSRKYLWEEIVSQNMHIFYELLQ